MSIQTRYCIVAAVLCLTPLGGAVAQPLYTLQQMIRGGVNLCIQQGRSPTFCNCQVNRWVGLWTPYDRDYWIRTGVATPHMVQMESVAAAQCGG